jgi:hypothetical protein
MLKFLKVFLAAAFFVPFPIVIEKMADGTFGLALDYAFASGGDDDDSESGNSGSGSSNSGSGSSNSGSGSSNSGSGNSGSGDDDSDDDDDNSGSGNSDDDRDDDDDNSGSGNRNDDSDDDDDNDSGSGITSSAGGGASRGKVANLHLRYANGWDEQILNGTYRLIDPQGRTVSNRRATQKDLVRMRELVDK